MAYILGGGDAVHHDRESMMMGVALSMVTGACVSTCLHMDNQETKEEKCQGSMLNTS